MNFEKQLLAWIDCFDKKLEKAKGMKWKEAPCEIKGFRKFRKRIISADFGSPLLYIRKKDGLVCIVYKDRIGTKGIGANAIPVLSPGFFTMDDLNLDLMKGKEK